MTEVSEAYREWAWVRPLLSLGFCLTVARGVGPEALADRLGLGPQRLVLNRDQAVDEFGVADPVVRIGAVPGWAFALQECGAEAGLPDVLRAVSAGTEAFTVWRTASAMSWFGHARDGELEVTFELATAHRRAGAAADGLVAAMSAVGLDPDRAWPLDSGVSPVLAGLALLTAVTGVRLGVAQVDSPLLTGDLDR